MDDSVSRLGVYLPFSLTGYPEKYFKRLTGNRGIEDSLERLDKLTQEEARMASAEQLKMTHRVDDRVRSVEGQVQDVDNKVQGVDNKVQGVDSKIQGVDDRVQDIDSNVKHISSKVQRVDDKIDQVNSSSSFQTLLVIPRLRQLHRKPA